MPKCKIDVYKFIKKAYNIIMNGGIVWINIYQEL